MALSRDEMIAQILAKQKAEKQVSPEPTRDEMIAQILARQKTAPEPTAEESANAALQGFGEQASFGYLPKMQAAVSAALPNPTAEVDSKLKEQGFQIPDEPTYEGEKAAFKQYGQEVAEKAPTASALGSIGGALATAAVPGGILGKAGKVGKAVFGGPAKSLLGRIGQSAASGAVTGAIQDTEGNRAENVGDAAIYGGEVATGLGLLGKTGRTLGKIAPGLKKFAEERAVSAAGAFKKDITRPIKKDPSGKTGETARNLGRFVLDEGLIKAGDKIDDIAERIGTQKTDIGSKIGSLYEKASEKGGLALNAEKIGDEFLESAATRWRGKPGGDKALRMVAQQVDNLKQNGQAVNLQAINEFRTGIDDLIPYEKGLEVLSKPEKEALLDMRRFLAKKVEEHLDVVDPAFKTELKALNSKYGKLAELDKISRNRMASETGNNLLSLTDKMALAGGIGVGVLSGDGDLESMAKRGAIGAGAGLLSKTARSYGRPLVMKAADVTGRGMLGTQNLVKDLVRSMTPQAAQVFASEVSRLKLTDPQQIGALAARYRGAQRGQ